VYCAVHQAQIGDLPLTVVDTGGLDDKDEFGPAMLPHTRRIVEHADVALFVVDARLGITPDDRHFAQCVPPRQCLFCAILSGTVLVGFADVGGSAAIEKAQSLWLQTKQMVFWIALTVR
jgi:tRNA U34 5-carboxymethylaminomethyl modifying GTPase MnmE/TrmE